MAKIKKYFLVPFFFARVSRVCDRVVPTKYFSTQRRRRIFFAIIIICTHVMIVGGADVVIDARLAGVKVDILLCPRGVTFCDGVYIFESMLLSQDEFKEVRPEEEVGKGKKAKQNKDQTQMRIFNMRVRLLR